jgi:hypothetical protein
LGGLAERPRVRALLGRHPPRIVGWYGMRIDGVFYFCRFCISSESNVAY